MGNPNVLMFDEPTNDFDIQTLGALEEYLDSFKGILLIVSHDRSFLDRTVDRIYSFENNGKIKEYPGNYSAYLEKKEQADQQNSHISNKEVKTQIQHSTQTKKGLSFHEKNEFEKLEKIIAEHEIQLNAMAKLIEEIPPHEYQKIADISQQMSSLEKESENNMMRWIELSDKQVKN
jgi:ATP-binding cassette subfamily F protein uup